MGRGRSPSPRRDRRNAPERFDRGDRGDRGDRDVERRPRSRSHERERRQRPRRSRSRSPFRKRSRSPRRRSPHGRRSRSASQEDDVMIIPKRKPFKVSRPKVDEAKLKDMEPEDADMMRMMGFSGFDSTKGKAVEGNDVGGSNIILKRKFRQYMNRRGGFNRPLDFIA